MSEIVEDSFEELLAQGIDDLTARQIVKAAEKYRAATTGLGEPPQLPDDDDLEACMAFLDYEEARGPALASYRDEMAAIWERQLSLRR